MVKRFLAIILFFSFSQLATAQNDCGESISLAQDAFDAGHIERIPGILHECINKFTPEQKVEAYRLLTITYLYMDDPFGAESSFLKLLEEDPEYRILDSDPIELEYLSKQYITTPIVSWSGKVGVNFSTVTILNYNRVDSDNGITPVYNTGAGFNLQGGLEVHFNKVVSLNTELELSSRSLVRMSGLFEDNQEIQVKDQDRFLMLGSLPISLRFTYPGVKYYPFVYAGYSPSYTLSSRNKEFRLPTRVAGVEASVDNLTSTTIFSHSLLFGIGMKRRIKYNYVLIDLRYRLGMTNMNNQQNQYNLTNPDTNKTRDKIFKFGTIDDDLRMNGIELTVGYVWPQYKPRAKNSVTLQTMVTKWFSKKDKGDE